MSSQMFEPDLLPLFIGSLPHTDPRQAFDLMLKWSPAIPTWPQLPRRTFLENMYVQFSQGFPGVVLEEDRIYVDRSQDLDPGLEQLYVAYLEDDVDAGALDPEYAAGFFQMSRQLPRQRLDGHWAVKGQVTGPISWGLTVVDQDRRPVLYDEILADAVAKHLRLKASWQERELRRLSPTTIVFVDEPYMSSFGSAYVSLSRDQVITLLEEVFAGLQGIKGVHCCGNTDWSLLLDTSADVLSFDAYEYAETLALYPEAVRAFLDRRGAVAWGIVPANDRVMTETVESLVSRLEEAMNLLVGKGVAFDDLIARAFISPSCGLGSQSEAVAERALELTASVSAEMKARYGGH